MNKEKAFQFLCSADDKSGYLKKEKGFKKNFPELYAELITWEFPEEFTFHQKLYHYFNNDPDFKLGLCLICNNRCKFINLQSGYLKHCSLKCLGKDETIKKKIKDTNLKKYGVENYSSTQECRNKVKEICLEKYGVENYSSTQECRNKVNETKKNKYGDKSYNNRQKAKNTCLEKYGVDNYSKTDKYIEKVNQTCIKKYGHKNYVQTEKFKSKCLEKYGVENYAQTNEFAKYHKKQIEYDGLTFDSSWEVIVYKYCKENNIPCEYQPDITFEYEYKGLKHYYHPDFLINDKLYEVKGEQFFDGDKMINPYNRNKYKDGIAESKHQCMIKNNVTILRGEDIEKLKDML